jgi:predicted ester cyclase
LAPFDCSRIGGILRFENGQAVERWGLADNLAIMQQLGLMG